MIVNLITIRSFNFSSSSMARPLLTNRVAVIASLAIAVFTCSAYWIYQKIAQRRLATRELQLDTEQRTIEAAGRYFPVKGQFDPSYLDFSHKRLEREWHALEPLLRSERGWDNPILITKFSALMEQAREEIDLIFHQVDELTEDHPEKAATMARMLADQGTTYNFCYKYFRCSLTQFYHLARGRVHIQNNRYRLPQTVTEEAKASFYTPGTPQYRWREIYNQFCAKLDHYQMKEAMRRKDGRFVNWAEPDLVPTAPFLPFPDTTPT
ncbi:hypothetical protein PNK_1844 [Candidatus Protochlamydia naegleriophila]|uniref:Uncharacterized protein n=1 Tax=Candidatus Protochlamydia naegleriophila TaxID=389348 RepID=A0A0U5JF48_9BACT|nr:hypothetical protein [Candidatus Protochlamydia naegleriophila]CUI17450.1 hypothetical protein PNK_1844 [Candidatus Protochlamydia naegleriophila]